MALFFDRDWFGRRLKAGGVTHDVLAAAAGLTMQELAAVWKDQRELSAAEVSAFAKVLGLDVKEVAKHCGVSTPHGAESADNHATLESRLDLILERLDRLEADVIALKGKGTDPEFKKDLK